MADLSVRQVLRVSMTGASLSFLAGFTNAVSVSATVAAAVASSHVTGMVTRLAAAAIPDARADAGSSGQPYGLPEGVALAGFIVGAMAAGAFIGPSPYFRMRFTTRHGAALIAESAALLAAMLLLGAGSVAGCFFAALAMGLQNGITTIYSGALLRTTHMTGVATDIGVLIGERLHQAVHRVIGKPEERALVQTEMWRLKFLVPLLVSFFAGAVAGVQGYATAGTTVLAFPVVATAVAGVAAIAYDRQKLAREKRTSPFSRMYDKTVGFLQPRRRRHVRARTDDGGEMFAAEDLQGGFAAADSAVAGHQGGAGGNAADSGSDRDRPGETGLSPTLEALAVRGDWDTLPYSMYIRHKQRQMQADADMDADPSGQWMPSLNFGWGADGPPPSAHHVGPASQTELAGPPTAEPPPLSPARAGTFESDDDGR